MKISNLYIDEAVRIRKEYLGSLVYINKYKDEINFLKEQLDAYKDELLNKSNITEEFFHSKLEDINKCINEINTKIKPYVDTITKLNDDQKKLYDIIKEKYLDITDDDIKNNIIPAISQIKI